MNTEALLALIADMYSQMAALQARVTELEAELAGTGDGNGKPAGARVEPRHPDYAAAKAG